MKETPLIRVLHSFQSKPKTFALMGFLITSLSAIKRCSNPRSSQFHMAYKNYNTLLLVWTRHCWRGSFWTKHRGTCKGSVHRSRTAYAEHSSSLKNPRSRLIRELLTTFWSQCEQFNRKDFLIAREISGSNRNLEIENSLLLRSSFYIFVPCRFSDIIRYSGPLCL